MSDSIVRPVDGLGDWIMKIKLFSAHLCGPPRPLRLNKFFAHEACCLQAFAAWTESKSWGLMANG